MNSKRIRLIGLHSLSMISRARIRTLLTSDPELDFLTNFSPEQFASLTGIPIHTSHMIYRRLKDPNIMKKLDNYFRRYTILTWFDDRFPPMFRTIPDPPLVLYIEGHPDLLSNAFSLSVIGTRKPSPYAFPAMKQVLTPLIKQGALIVSGMAYGIDQYAHTLAVHNGGKTAAVLGSGFEHIYPSNNLSLYKQMADHHIVISEYPPDMPPKKYHFPERNRLISGLSPATFVIEAKMRSGTMITVDQALEQGRSVYALPGPAGSPTSEGCHHLINEGAKLVHTYQDIAEDWFEKFE
ncbi:DNA-protecting protein DprA [Halobacillus kuroshimensis]|uniref:DNA-protecting protein DprA n=1 Tax=Halobacillus kuroshimensis TaxID=302481 RepID=A0ABS3DSW0_9BACI|nr:DNA-processing protein DprA [Halobacillus kuroshimensis]MBN8234438.1 DNA-protecting protein DprA [Halobacillus kuroshimensis]